MNDSWLALENGFSIFQNQVALRLKRLLDILFSLILLVLTIPIVILSMILIVLFDGFPIFYSQKRVGINGTCFNIIKFRTMKKDAENKGPQFSQKNDSRITTLGRIFRKLRIDELPKLINVFKGEMSFIGPRPERPEFVEEIKKIEPFYDLRHVMRPGITGWAQVLFPYGASFDDSVEKFCFDLYYIKNYSLLLEFSILVKTVRIVLTGSGRLAIL